MAEEPVDDVEMPTLEAKTSKSVGHHKKKTKQPGIIYLSRIPTYMNVTKTRNIFETYGEIGRIFLQPDDKGGTHVKKNRSFEEGWVEFLDKKVAKRVALALNNQQIGGKRKSPWYEENWNIKYLHRFKWGHLNEKLAYEKAVHQQRLRTEITQVKKESSFFIQNVEKQKVRKRLEKKQKKPEFDREWGYKQKSTEEEIINAKNTQEKKPGKHRPEKVSTNVNFLKSIFSGGMDSDED